MNVRAPVAPTAPGLQDAPVASRANWPARAIALGTLILLAAGPAVAASAQTSRSPKVDGTVAGGSSVGDQLTIRVDALVIGGFQSVRDVTVDLVSGGSDIEAISFDRVNNLISVGDHEVAVGTGAAASGSYLRVSGANVILTTGGAHLSFTVIATVIKELPSATRFRLGVHEVSGQVTSVTRDLNVGVQKGLTWGTVVAAVIAALLAGGLVGNLFASRRRPPPRLSVYGTIQRRLAEERPASTKS